VRKLVNVDVQEIPTMSDNAQMLALLEALKGQRVIIWLVDGKNTGGKVGATSAGMVEIQADGGQIHHVVVGYITNVIAEKR
jgi:hypothetical protein